MGKEKKTATGCRPSSLIGFWAIESSRFDAMYDVVARQDWVALAADFDPAHAEAIEMNVPAEPPKGPPPKPYVNHNGIAEILISGPTTKHPTSFSDLIGGTSTILAERKLRLAVADPDVSGIMLHFDDAPGGTVAGAFEFRDAIRKAAKLKPLWGHGDDMIASASMMFGAAAKRLTANQNASVGSIGVRTHVDDTSARFEKEGVKRISIHQGKFKAAGLSGTPVTPEVIEYLQNNVDKLGNLFINSIVEDRKLDAETVRGMEAKVFIGAEAQEKGLIDGVCSYEDALGEMIQKHGRKEQTPPPAPQPGARMDRTKLIALLNNVYGAQLAADATDGQIEAAINRAGTELMQLRAAQPKAPDPELLSARLEVAEQRIDLAVEKGDVPPTVAAQLKKLAGVIDGGNKPNAALLVKSEAFGGKAPLDAMLGLFDGLKIDPQANKGGKSDQKPEIQNRTIPGATDDENDPAKALERGRQAAASAKAGMGLAPAGGNGQAK